MSLYVISRNYSRVDEKKHRRELSIKKCSCKQAFSVRENTFLLKFK